MSAYCYIIFSQKLNRFYTGISQSDPQVRLEKHNLHLYGEHRFTAEADDWELFLTIPVEDVAHARRLELLIKGMKSSKYIQNLKKYPEIIEKIVRQTSDASE